MTFNAERGTESQLWLELLEESGCCSSGKIQELRGEALQLVAMTVASIRTARGGSRSVPRSAFRDSRSV